MEAEDDYSYLSALRVSERRIVIEKLEFPRDDVAFAARASMDNATLTVRYLKESIPPELAVTTPKVQSKAKSRAERKKKARETQPEKTDVDAPRAMVKRKTDEVSMNMGDMSGSTVPKRARSDDKSNRESNRDDVLSGSAQDSDASQKPRRKKNMGPNVQSNQDLRQLARHMDLNVLTVIAPVIYNDIGMNITSRKGDGDREKVAAQLIENPTPRRAARLVIIPQILY